MTPAAFHPSGPQTRSVGPRSSDPTPERQLFISPVPPTSRAARGVTVSPGRGGGPTMRGGLWP